MNRPNKIVQYSDSKSQVFDLTSLDALGRSEAYLEEVLASHPALLQLENRRTNIASPFRIFRQLSLPTPSGRVIFPDLVILAASGHVVVVEVKLGINPELRNRAVISQIVEYSAAFSGMVEDQIVTMFSRGEQASEWERFVDREFPGEGDLSELANVSNANAKGK
ncbi:MAG: hypothetical protein R3C03_17785 [Pirellulaceae bacterium]